MAGYVKNVVINCNPDGSFASATQLRAGVMETNSDGDTVDMAQPNEAIDLEAVKAFIGGLQ